MPAVPGTVRAVGQVPTARGANPTLCCAKTFCNSAVNLIYLGSCLLEQTELLSDCMWNYINSYPKSGVCDYYLLPLILLILHSSTFDFL